MKDAKSSDRIKSRCPNSQRSFVPLLLLQNISSFPKCPPLTMQQSSKQLFSSPSIFKHAEYAITKLLFCPSTRDFIWQSTSHLFHMHRPKGKMASSPSLQSTQGTALPEPSTGGVAPGRWGKDKDENDSTAKCCN